MIYLRSHLLYHILIWEGHRLKKDKMEKWGHIKLQALGFGRCVVIKNVCLYSSLILLSFCMFLWIVLYLYHWHPYSNGPYLQAKDFIIVYCNTSSLLDRRGKDFPFETVAHIPPGHSKGGFFFFFSGKQLLRLLCNLHGLLAITSSVSRAVVSNKCTYLKQF